MSEQAKKIIYSGVTKIIAVALFALCCGAIVISCCKVFGIMRIYDYYEDDEFEYTQSIQYDMTRAVTTLMQAIVNDENGNDEVQRRMADLHADYYAECGEKVYTNAPELSAFPLDGYYYYAIRENAYWKAGGITSIYFSMDEAPSSDCRIYVRLQDDYVNKCKQEWIEAKEEFKNGMITISLFFAVGILFFIYLLFVSGKRADDEDIHFMAIDRLPTEINAAGLIVSLIGVMLVMVFLDESVAWNEVDYNIVLPIGMIISAGSLLQLAFLMSLVRTFKSGKLIKKSIMYRILKIFYNKFGNIFSVMKSSTFTKTSVFYTAALFIYVMISIFMMFATHSIIPTVIMLAAAFLYVLKSLKSADEILKGISELKRGNTNYKIPEQKGIFSEVAEAVNSVGEGMTNAVQVQLKSERMKSELITNVSHDLKTPLTSIINYSDLLCKEKLQPEKANEYADIIRNKSEHLKKITSDLFDISKVQSGSVVVKEEEIDAMLLINQTMGELDGEIKKSDLEFVVKADDNCISIGDGEKLSRVFENIIANAVKYSLKGSRVYVSVRNTENSVEIEVKNIASYRMDFDDSEITERFVRGDSSRTTEGSGLGLAIAKSYTEACGGTFRIVTDGDLFKCMIGLKKGK